MALSRFADDLPAVGEFVTLGEGDTPVVPLSALARRLGLRGLSAKMESQNPTGSYKDRVAAMSLSLARHQGRRGWIASSSGNAGVSMATYGARAGLPGFLFLVASAPPEKRVPLMPYGIGIVGVDGVGDGATSASLAALFDEIRAAALRHDLYLGITAHAFNPDGMRGVDTIGFELAEQVPKATQIYVPVGGGGLLVATARGLSSRRHPARIVACQPSGCAPVVETLDGIRGSVGVDACTSRVSGLQLPNPPDGHLAVAAVRSSGGWGVATHDDQIFASQQLLARVEGVFVEPAAAATLAAVCQDVEDGRLGAGDHPVLILTGAGWKDLGRYAAPAADLPVVALAGMADEVDGWAVRLGSQA